MIFELINPSDKCTFEAPNLKIAAIITCVLGNGQYSAKGMQHDLDVPFFLSEDMKSGLSLDLELILKKHLYKFEMQKKKI